MNITYIIEQVNQEWELTIMLVGLDSSEHTGFLNQENDVMTLGCPEDQYGNITETFVPYTFSSLQDLMKSVQAIEEEKNSIIDCYLFNNIGTQERASA